MPTGNNKQAQGKTKVKRLRTLWDCELLARKTLQNSPFFQGDDTARLAAEAKYLVEGVWKISSARRILLRPHEVTLAQEKHFMKALERRKLAEPLAYIVGEKEFCGHTFALDKSTLIPRSDSETLIDMVCACVQQQKIVCIDWGTGSGCLLISVLYRFPQAMGIGIDKSSEALSVAKKNGIAHRMENRLIWCEGDWQHDHTFTLPKGYAVIVICNPPYVDSPSMSSLAPSVHDFEPHSALDGGKDGLRAIEQVLSSLVNYPKETRMFMEIGKGQGDAVRSTARLYGWQYRQSSNDMQGIERVLRFDR